MKQTLLLILFAIPLLSQAQTPIVLTIDNKEEVTLDEFKRIYLKNNTKPESNPLERSAIDQYLDMFTKFKLKVYEAKQLNLDKRQSFKDELKKYRDQLAEPYLVDQSVSEQLYREAYDRMFKVVRSSHILFRLPPTPTPQDTLEVYNKAMNIKKRIEKGEEFYMLAMKYSEDPSAKINMGEIGYFSSMRMVYPFENAAYNTPIGAISDPIKTQFGYHLVKTSDKIDIEGPIDISIIVVRDQKDENTTEQNSAKAKIDAAYDSLAKGVTIEKVVKQFSEDKKSLATNGLINHYEPGKMFPYFDSLAWRLTEGKFTKPFYTPQTKTWTIIYLNKKQRHPSYAETQELIKRRINRMPHSYLRSKTLATKLLAQYKTERQEPIFDQSIDTLISLHNNNLLYPASMDQTLTQPILVIEDTFKINQSEFVKFANAKIKLRIEDMRTYCESNWQEFVERSVIKYEDHILHVKYPEFANTVKEYYEGILLFNITDSIVWQKATTDTIGLKEYYQQTSHKYQWGERVEAILITANKPALKSKIEKIIKSQIKKGELNNNAEAIVRKRLKDTTLTLQATKLTVEKGHNNLIDKTNFKKGLTIVNDNINETTWCYIVKTIPPESKKLNEIRGLVTAEYQNQLEANWIQELKSKYKTEINQDALESLYHK